MKKLKVVISGTCHGGVIKSLLESSPAFNTAAQLTFVPNYQTLNRCFEPAPLENLLPALEGCDVLIYHDIRAYSFPKLIAGLKPGALAVSIPYITSKLYWPTYSLEPFWLIKRGATAYIPFPCLVLNRLIEDCRDPAAAKRAYLRMDLAKTVDMDALVQDQLDYLRRIQAGTVFDFARFTEENFRHRKLFHLINHPAIAYFEMLASSILRAMGLPDTVTPPPDPFLKHQMPVHPSIIAHHGLTWCTPDTRWRAIDRDCTFEEHVGWYVDAYLARITTGDDGPGLPPLETAQPA